MTQANLCQLIMAEPLPPGEDNLTIAFRFHTEKAEALLQEANHLKQRLNEVHNELANLHTKFIAETFHFSQQVALLKVDEVIQRARKHSNVSH
jgi:hypothetical protein